MRVAQVYLPHGRMVRRRGLTVRTIDNGAGQASLPASGAATRQVLNVHGVAELLGKSERGVHELRAAGLLPEPIQLGPRSLRWFRDEVLAHLAEHAPRGGHAEPAQLARGRAAKKA